MGEGGGVVTVDSETPRYQQRQFAKAAIRIHFTVIRQTPNPIKVHCIIAEAGADLTAFQQRHLYVLQMFGR